MSFIEWLKKALGCKCEEKDIEITNLQNQIGDLKLTIEALKRTSKSPYEEPEVLGSITNSEVTNLLKPYCNDFHLSDSNYGLTSVAEAKRFSEETKVMARKWMVEHDCDEFSFALMGYWNDGLKQFCFGIAWSNLHAFNIMIDNKKQIWIVEPQSNKFMKIEDVKDNTSYYPFRIVLI